MRGKRGSPTRRGAAVAAGWMALAMACHDPAAIPDPGVSIVSVTPTAATLVPGQELQLVGEAQDRSRNPLPEKSLEWVSSDPTLATVSAAGLVSALSPGGVVITATSEGASATATLAIDEGGWIGPAGGTVSAFGGAFSLEVPENALAAPVAVRVLRFGHPPLDPTSAGGEFDLRLQATFSAPAALTLRYLPEDAPAGVAESALGVRLLTIGNWGPVAGSTAEPASDRVTAPVSSPGVYGVGRLPPTTPCTAPEHRQFDFWAGRWDVAPTGSGPGTRQASSSITIEAGGCAIFEDFRDLEVRGESISLYDPVTAQWYQTYVDNTGVRLLLAGGVLGDAMVLTEPGNASRITWSTAGADVRQFGEASADGGASWTAAFDLTYRPR